jgi:hypothetical protein
LVKLDLCLMDHGSQIIASVDLAVVAHSHRANSLALQLLPGRPILLLASRYDKANKILAVNIVILA